MSTKGQVRNKSRLNRNIEKKRRVKNTKEKGNRNERKTREWIQSDGWDSINAKASLGPFDIWAAHPDYDEVRLIQVKTNNMPPPAERNIMATYNFGPKNRKEIWIWVDRAKEPRVILYVEERDSWIETT